MYSVSLSHCICCYLSYATELVVYVRHHHTNKHVGLL